ncbi:TetR/AcrR family transcriptional regulator [Streptomyces sp. NPDC001868]|uniref:TetR/AcrR family transcriptional regulator n=1 Tax=Streptomyces sp. NPDC001868 TaxID=3154401 RepID=UPI00331F91B7
MSPASTSRASDGLADQIGERKGEWRRSAGTRKAVLDAARRLFNEKGYDDTNINDIVTASGVSVGSIYHQFGGKKEVFRALAEASLARHREVSERATKKAVGAGETDPLRIYVEGAKAYLLDTWKQRDIDRVAILLEGPAPEVAVSREQRARYLRGSLGITIGEPPMPDATGYALYGLLTGAATQLMSIEDRRTANAVINYFADLILKMGDAD